MSPPAAKAARPRPPRRRDHKTRAHDPAGFVISLSAMSENTRRAYEHDAREFVQWCERGGCPDASALDHRVLRRYLALPPDPRLLTVVDRPQGRVGARVPPPPPPPRRARPRRRRRGPGAEGRAPPAAHAAPQGSRRAARRSRPNEAEPDDPGALRDLAIVELLYGAGLRVSECCGLDVGDVDLTPEPRSPRSEKVQKSAGCRSANRPATAVAAYVRTGRAAWPSSPTTQCGGRASALFVNARGRRMTPRDVRRVLDRHPLADGRVIAPPRAAARLRHAPPRRGSRSQSSSGAARTRRCGNDTDLHSRDP